MSPRVTDNAAGRLIVILEDFKKARSDSPMDAWSETLHASNMNELFARIADLGYLIDTVRERVRNLPEDEGPDFLLSGLEPLDELVNGFGRLGVTTKDRLANILKPSLMQALSVASRALSREQSEALIESSDLRDLLDDVQHWLGTVSNDTNLNTHDKIFISYAG